MSNPFVCEIRMFPFNFAPLGWAMCNGQILPISQNTAVFSLLGTNFGGDGKSNFGLPNLQGSVAMHQDSNSFGLHPLGDLGGSDAVTLTTQELPAHTHVANSVAAVNKTTAKVSPIGAVWATEFRGALDYDSAHNTTMAADVLTPVGQSQPHNNLMPYLTLNFCIALQGVFPPRP